MKYLLKKKYLGMRLSIAGVRLSCDSPVEVAADEAKAYSDYMETESERKKGGKDDAPAEETPADEEEAPKDSKKK